MMMMMMLSKFSKIQSALQKCYGFATTSKFQQSGEYDLIVVGGGSGGLACSKQAAELGAKVALLDYVEPSPVGTKWGLGGTCVNVGCIPKKLMHEAALVRHAVDGAHKYGWDVSRGSPTVDWHILTSAINNYVKSLNWGYRVQLKDKNVEYINAIGSFVDPKSIMATASSGKTKILKSKNVVLATGLRPRYPEISGSGLGVSSDDIFTMKKSPGKTLVIGGSYVALECAGFLSGLGLPVTLMIRSIPLRGFDRQMSDLVASAIAAYGTEILTPCVPDSLSQDPSGSVTVTWSGSGGQGSGSFDTVLWAIGREPKLSSMNLEGAGVNLDESSGKIIVDENDQTNIRGIFAIGDIAQGRPELTPVAIHAGKLLSRRLFGDGKELMDYANVATTVFTPLEYSAVGMSEETAIEQLGADNLEIFHAFYKPLESHIPERHVDECYIKAIAKLNNARTILGLHFVGPNAGEVMQGFAAAMKCGLTMDVLQSTIGIHPTCAEEIVKLNITKRSGKDPAVTGC